MNNENLNYLKAKIINYLNSIYKPGFSDEECHKSYFWDEPDKPRLDEYKEYGDCEVWCFRTPGYTIGHLIYDNINNKVLDIVVYSRNEDTNQFILNTYELKKKLLELVNSNEY